jgi:hypothetical protein
VVIVVIGQSRQIVNPIQPLPSFHPTASENPAGPHATREASRITTAYVTASSINGQVGMPPVLFAILRRMALARDDTHSGLCRR